MGNCMSNSVLMEYAIKKGGLKKVVTGPKLAYWGIATPSDDVKSLESM